MSLLARLAERLPGRRLWRVAGALGALSLTAASPWWGPAALSGLSYFRVRRIEIVGARYIAPRSIIERLDVDTATSVWLETEALERRVMGHPQVRRVRVERRLPGTLVVRVEEKLPVALVPASDGLRAYDADGEVLPIDPSRVDVDLPIVQRRDTALFRILDDVRERQPALYGRISEVRRQERGDLAIAIPPMLVRASSDLTADRLADILPVEGDLARRQARVAELDLRFRDQVVARLQ
ncbi:MAG TPA: FtsQ-type POTRA domain-containing protein [Gemmatimonadaceae bacterium]|nr:FtsQ-type POTRA domain-containing protein [Gemmatimonadaceae bacterium]